VVGISTAVGVGVGVVVAVVVGMNSLATLLARLRTRLLALCRSLPSRFYGSYVAPGEDFARLSTQAEFPEDGILAARVRAARGVLVASGRNVDREVKP
jgi:hypothetical protein